MPLLFWEELEEERPMREFCGREVEGVVVRVRWGVFVRLGVIVPVCLLYVEKRAMPLLLV